MLVGNARIRYKYICLLQNKHSTLLQNYVETLSLIALIRNKPVTHLHFTGCKLQSKAGRLQENIAFDVYPRFKFWFLQQRRS